MNDSERSDVDPDVINDVYRMTSDLVLLKHRAMDRPVDEDSLPYLRAGLALAAATAIQILRDSLESEGEELDLERLLHTTRIFRAWHIMETVSMRPWIGTEVSGTDILKRPDLRSRVHADQAVEDLLELSTSQLNQIHTEVVLIDEGESL